MTDWYDDLRRKDRRAHERLGLPEFDVAPLADYAEVPGGQVALYLVAMGETRTVDDGIFTRWTCGCRTQRIRAGETIRSACAKHAGKVG